MPEDLPELFVAVALFAAAIGTWFVLGLSPAQEGLLLLGH